VCEKCAFRNLAFLLSFQFAMHTTVNKEACSYLPCWFQFHFVLVDVSGVLCYMRFYVGYIEQLYHWTCWIFHRGMMRIKGKRQILSTCILHRPVPGQLRIAVQLSVSPIQSLYHSYTFGADQKWIEKLLCKSYVLGKPFVHGRLVSKRNIISWMNIFLVIFLQFLLF
jgi:hypothetical protein